MKIVTNGIIMQADGRERYLLLVLGGLEEVAAVDVRSHLSDTDPDAAVTVLSPCDWKDANGVSASP